MRTRSQPAVPMSSDFEELLRIFNGNEVKYLIVGGYAVMLYTEPRYTKDLDVWVQANPENAAKVWRALVEFGAPLAGIGPDDFAREGFFYHIGQPPVRVDILMSIDGVISQEDLLKNKPTTGRHIDLHDAGLLE
jgi:hypothetical protein